MTITINIFGLETSKRFENQIRNFIEDQFDFYQVDGVENITLQDAGIRRIGGYGQYEKFVNLFIGNDEYNLTDHTTDSELFDFFNNNEVNRTYSNRMKSLVLEVLESRFESQVIEKL